MDVGLLRSRAAGAGRRTQRGISMLEALVVLGLTGLLTFLGLVRWNAGHLELTAAQHDLVESLDQAFVLARARGSNVKVGLASGQGPDYLPVRVGPRVKWGKPPGVPLPPGMEDPVKADSTGEAHPFITVTPRRTATASLWFLHDGEDAICLRLSNRGRIQLLRWRASTRRWSRS